MTKEIRMLCSVLIGVLVALPAMASPLQNPGFEAGVIPDSIGAIPGDNGAVPNWPRFTFTSLSTATTDLAHSGDWSLVQMGGNNTSSGGSTGVFQLVTGAVAGESYTVNVWAKSATFPVFYFEDESNNPDGGTVENVNIRFFFKDAGGTTIEQTWDNIGHLLNPNWQQFSATRVAPPGTAQLQIGLYRRRVATTVYWDDVELLGRFVPEPASLGLALLGAVGILFKRR